MVRFFSGYVPIRHVIYVGIEFFLVLSILALELRSLGPDTPLGLWQILLVPFVFLFCLYYTGSIDMNTHLSSRNFVIKNIQAVAAALAVLLALYALLPWVAIDQRLLLVNLLVLSATVVVARATYRKLIDGGRWDQRLLIIGSGKIAEQIRGEVHRQGMGYRVVGQLHEDPPLQPETLLERVRTHRVRKIVIAMNDRRGQFPLKTLLQLKVGGVDVVDGIAFYERLMGKILVEPLNPSFLIFNSGFRRSWLIRGAKRTADCIVSALGLILTSPLFLIVPLLIKLDSRGAVFFRQERVGENGKIFALYKFRSMQQDAEAETGPVWTQVDDPRITRVGRLLRLLRIDELPQIFNVLKGEMSFVGPRPERPEFVGKLREAIPYYDLRLTVRPGITGWAQVKYSYGASEEDAVEKLQYDLYYIKNHTLFFDFAVLVKTVQVVLLGKGAR